MLFMDTRDLTQARDIYRYYIVKGGLYLNNNAVAIAAKLNNLLQGCADNYAELDKHSDKSAAEIKEYVDQRLGEQAIVEARQCMHKFQNYKFYSTIQLKGKLVEMTRLLKFADVDRSALDEIGQKSDENIRQEVMASYKDQCLKNSERILKRLIKLGVQEYFSQEDLDKMSCADLYFGGIASSKDRILDFLNLPEAFSKENQFSEEEEARKSSILQDIDKIHATACLRSVGLFSSHFSSYHAQTKIEVSERLLSSIDKSVLDEANLKRFDAFKNSLNTKKAVTVATEQTGIAVQDFFAAGGEFDEKAKMGLERAIADYFQNASPKQRANTL